MPPFGGQVAVGSPAAGVSRWSTLPSTGTRPPAAPCWAG